MDDGGEEGGSCALERRGATTGILVLYNHKLRGGYGVVIGLSGTRAQSRDIPFLWTASAVVVGSTVLVIEDQGTEEEDDDTN